MTHHLYTIKIWTVLTEEMNHWHVVDGGNESVWLSMSDSLSVKAVWGMTTQQQQVPTAKVLYSKE